MTQEENEANPSVDSAADLAAAAIRKGLPKALLLSEVVGGAPESGPSAYVPPTAALRSEARETIHGKAVADIARLRFDYPTEKYPDFKTYANKPGRTMGIEMADSRVAYPDIVVVQHPENYTKIVAQVETNETIREGVASHEWLPYSDLGPLYLYVPVGKGDEALSLCKQLDIPVVGIRTWRYMAGYEEPEINDHYTAASGPGDLLPKILRPG
ncbi:MAG: hypothetical protein IH957_00395 [Chloroflexi bacterium]|nr:hypothetical protein [Chloroflexota bacterium]